MFRTKICGVTNAQDAEMVQSLGGDAIGLNFHPSSVRYIGAGSAASRAANWGGNDLLRVGVFVNAPSKTIRAAIAAHGLGAIQFHGDEPPATLAEFTELRRIKAFRIQPDIAGEVGEYLSRCDALGCLPDAVLVDAWREGTYGGTGAVADWEWLAQHRTLFGSLPLILAGGLTPANVAEAIAIVRPHGVDVAGGVEEAPGVKDHRKTADFLNRAHQAFSNL